MFSREAVLQPAQVLAIGPSAAQDVYPDATQDATLNCHGYGSVVSVTATFGQCAAGWVLDKISLA